jgi:hypothetical protein
MAPGFFFFNCTGVYNTKSNSLLFKQDMRQIQGRLKAFSVQTTQGEWNFDVSTITGAATQSSAGVAAQPQPSAPPQLPGARNANVVKISCKPPAKIVQQSLAESSRARDLPRCYDDDDFMKPLPRHPVAKKQCAEFGSQCNWQGTIVI